MTERLITIEQQIAAPRADVWRVLADFPNIADWNSGVKVSRATSSATGGIGATRHCDLAPAGGLDETVTDWQDEQRLVISIDKATVVPIDHAQITFVLESSPSDEWLSIATAPRADRCGASSAHSSTDSSQRDLPGFSSTWKKPHNEPIDLSPRCRRTRRPVQTRLSPPGCSRGWGPASARLRPGSSPFESRSRQPGPGPSCRPRSTATADVRSTSR